MPIKIENARLKLEVTIDTGTPITVASDATVIRSIRSYWKFHRKQISKSSFKWTDIRVVTR